jgi:C-methyltransferase
LVTSSPTYLGGNLRVAASDWEWEALGRLPEAVRAGGTVLAANADTPNFPFWEDFATFATPFTARGAELVADSITPWAADRTGLAVLDVACGHGQYGFAVAQRLPESHLTCLDWPAVLAVTRENAARAGLADRVDYRPGDMFTTDPGGPYDVIVISNVLHHFAEPRATELLTRLAGALRPDGRLVVVGFTVDEEVAPVDDPRPYLFSLHMLSLTPEGETHSAQTYRRMLTAAGLGRVETVTATGQPLTVLIGAAPPAA